MQEGGARAACAPGAVPMRRAPSPVHAALPRLNACCQGSRIELWRGAASLSGRLQAVLHFRPLPLRAHSKQTASGSCVCLERAPGSERSNTPTMWQPRPALHDQACRVAVSSLSSVCGLQWQTESHAHMPCLLARTSLEGVSQERRQGFFRIHLDAHRDFGGRCWGLQADALTP